MSVDDFRVAKSDRLVSSYSENQNNYGWPTTLFLVIVVLLVCTGLYYNYQNINQLNQLLGRDLNEVNLKDRSFVYRVGRLEKNLADLSIALSQANATAIYFKKRIVTNTANSKNSRIKINNLINDTKISTTENNTKFIAIANQLQVLELSASIQEEISDKLDSFVKDRSEFNQNIYQDLFRIETRSKENLTNSKNIKNSILIIREDIKKLRIQLANLKNDIKEANKPSPYR